MRLDLYGNASVVQVIDPDTFTADKAADTYADMQGYHAALIICAVGASGDTIDGSNYIVHKVTECATTGGTYTAVPRANIVSAIASGTAGEISLFDNDTHAEDDSVHAVVYPTLRYLKVSIDVTGTHTNGTPGSVTVVRLGNAYNPVST